MTELDWTSEPYHRRTLEQEMERATLINEWIERNAYRCTNLDELVEVTAQPTTVDRHNFTPTERITLDFEGKF